MKSIEWFYDFVSPFCYLQFELLDRLEREVRVEGVPVLLAGILSARGQLGPAEIPEKRRFTYRMVQWVAERDGVPLRFPPSHPFNPLRALRLVIAAGAEPQAARHIFRYLWRDGRSLEDKEGWRELCDLVGIPDADARIADPAVKEQLRRNGERALQAGVFGVPTLAIDGELFWGADSTGMAIDFLRDPGKFARGEYARLSTLPIGVERTRG